MHSISNSGFEGKDFSYTDQWEVQSNPMDYGVGAVGKADGMEDQDGDFCVLRNRF